MQDMWNSLMDLLLHDRSNEDAFIYILIMIVVGGLFMSGRLGRRFGDGGGGDGYDGGGDGGGE